jgi:zinc transport system permease protein
MIEAIFKYTFMQNALIAAILASMVCGLIGTIIVEKRLVSMSGGIAHASFGGIGLGYLIGIEPIWGGLLFAVGSSLSIPSINRRTSAKSDTLIGIFWSVGMALGILFISLMPGYPPDMTSYLFGDILTVSRTYLYVMAVMTIVLIFLFGSLYTHWQAYLFDEEFTGILGVKVQWLEKILYTMIALSIVVLIKVVGIILVIALLTIPAATAKLFFVDLKKVISGAIGFGMLYSIVGLYLSYTFNIASGASIILFAAVVYFAAQVVRGK